MTSLWTAIPCQVGRGQVEHAMDVPGKTVKGGPLGTKEPNKKHMTSSRNYMYSLRRAQLVQDGKGLEAVKENERASFSIVSCKPKWGVPRQIWRLSGVGRVSVLSTAFLLHGVAEAISDCSKVLLHYMFR